MAQTVRAFIRLPPPTMSNSLGDDIVTLLLPLEVCQALLCHFESLDELNEPMRLAYSQLHDCVENLTQSVWNHQENFFSLIVNYLVLSEIIYGCC